MGKTKQQIYWLKINNIGLLVFSPGTVGYQGVQAAARQRRGLRVRGVGLAPLWTYALSSEINHSLYHSCSIWSHNHYPTAEKEMKPLIARGVGLSVQSRKVFIKFSFEKWFFMASLPGRGTQKLGVLQQLSTTHPPAYRTNIIYNCYNEVLTCFSKFSSIILNHCYTQLWHGETFNHEL